MTDATAEPRDVASRPGPAEGPMAVLSAGEVAALVAWPWFLAAAVAASARGARGEDTGEAAAWVFAAGVAYLAFVAAPLVASRLAGLPPGERALRAGVLAALTGALSLPALVAVAAASPSPSGTVACGAVLVSSAAYALAQAAAVGGKRYPSVAVLWLGGPPFAFYVVLDVLGRKATWLLALSPASGAAWTAYGGASAWSRLAGPLLVLALAGGSLSVLASQDRALQRRA